MFELNASLNANS